MVYKKLILIFLLTTFDLTLFAQLSNLEFSNYIAQQTISIFTKESGILIAQKLTTDSIINNSETKERRTEVKNSKKVIKELPDTLKNSEIGKKIVESVNFSSNTFLNDTFVYSVNIDSYLEKGHLHHKTGNADSLYAILQHLANLIKNDSLDSRFFFPYYHLHAKYYGLKADFINELEYLLKAKSVLRETQLEKLVLVNQRIAIIYYRLLDFESSLALYENNLEVVKKTGNNLELLYTYYGIADAHNALGNQEYAKKTCFKAITLNEKTGESQAFGFIYSLLGYIYMEESKIDSAEYYLNKGISISKDQNEYKELYDNYNAMVKVQLLKEDTLKAQFYAEKAIDNKIYHDADLHTNLASIYSSQKKYLQANKLLKKNIKHYNDINDKNFAFSLASTLLKNRFEQEKILQISQSKQKFQNTLIWIITIASILLFLLFSIIVFTQINHRKKIQRFNKKLIEKNENLEQFAYICSHDLKEPIRNIGSFTSLIQNKLKNENLKSDYDEYFQIINGGTSVLIQIVNSLKIFTSLNQDGVVSKSKMSLNLTIKETIQSLSFFIQKNEATISINDELENQEIYSSMYGVKLILINLIQNAIKHNQSKNKTIDISIKKLKNDILITVKDNGLGIPKEYFKQIFLPFKTLRNKTVTESSGLGLAICNKIINIMGGKIWVESEIGKGSKFYILLNQ